MQNTKYLTWFYNSKEMKYIEYLVYKERLMQNQIEFA